MTLLYHVISFLMVFQPKLFIGRGMHEDMISFLKYVKSENVVFGSFIFSPPRYLFRYVIDLELIGYEICTLLQA